MRRFGFLLSISLFWLMLSALSDGITALLLPQRLLTLSAGQNHATILGLVSFLGLLAGMLIQPPAGALSDRLRPRWGRKSMLAAGTLLVLVALGVFAIPAGLASLTAGFLLVQVGLSVVQAAQQGFIPDRVPAPERGRASGWKNLMDIGGAMLGFMVIGRLLGEGEIQPALLWMAGMMLAGLGLTTALVREPREVGVQVSRHPSAGFSPLKPGLRLHTTFIWLVLARFFFLFGTFAVGRFLLLFIADRLGMSVGNASEAAGNVLAGLTLVTAATAPLAGWAVDRFGRRPLMFVGCILSAAGTGGYLVAGSLVQIFLFGGLLSVGSAAFASANWAMTADVVPKQESARFFGIANFGTAGAAAAAGLLGPLVDVLNRTSPGRGYVFLFTAAVSSYLVSIACQQGLRKAGHRIEKPDKSSVSQPSDTVVNVADQQQGLDK